jgi:predicted RNase H-like HicB family nuclease
MRQDVTGLPKYHVRMYKPVRDADGSLIHYVEFVELPELGASGGTPTEALLRLWEALPGQLAFRNEHHLPIPPAQSSGVVRVGAIVQSDPSTQPSRAPSAAPVVTAPTGRPIDLERPLTASTSTASPMLVRLGKGLSRRATP